MIAIKSIEKQSQSSTPADSPVDIFNPYNSVIGLNFGLNLSTGISAGIDD